MSANYHVSDDKNTPRLSLQLCQVNRELHALTTSNIVNFILMTKFTIGLQAQLVVQTQQNMFALRISDHNPNRGWGNINIQAVIIGLYLRFCATRKLRENISS